MNKALLRFLLLSAFLMGFWAGVLLPDLFEEQDHSSTTVQETDLKDRGPGWDI